MSARAQAVLDRFPLHLAAADPGKRFEVVVGGITDTVEVLTRQLADVRRSHRLSEAPTPADVHGLAGGGARELERPDEDQRVRLAGACRRRGHHRVECAREPGSLEDLGQRAVPVALQLDEGVADQPAGQAGDQDGDERGRSGERGRQRRHRRFGGTIHGP